MEDKPYYEQEYHEPKTDIPRPTFGQHSNFCLLHHLSGMHVVFVVDFGMPMFGQLFCESF